MAPTRTHTSTRTTQEGSPSSDSYQHVESRRFRTKDAADDPEGYEEHDADDGQGGDGRELDSEDDEKMSDFEGGSHGSSDAESETPGMVNPTQMTYVGLSQCRIRTSVKTEDGVQVQCICGRETTSCRRHTRQRIGGRTRHPPGYYVTCIASQGGHLHGKLGTRISRTEWEARLAEEKEQVEEDIEAQQDDDSGEEEEELNRLRAENRRGVGFNTGSQGQEPPLEEDTARVGTRDGLNLGTAFDKADVHTPEDQGPWYALEDRTGGRWTTNDEEEAEFLVKAKFTPVTVFGTEQEAQRWMKQQGSPLEKDAPSRKDQRGKKAQGDRNRRQKKKHPKEAKKPHRKVHKKKSPIYSSSSSNGGTSGDSSDPEDSEEESSDDESEDSEYSSEEDSSDTDSSCSSSSSSDSESSWSSGDKPYGRHKKKSKRRIQKKKRAKRKKSKKGHRERYKGQRGRKQSRKKGSKKTKSRRRRRGRVPKIFSVDPSTGNSRMIYGKHVSRIRDKAGPPGMRLKDTDELFEAALDVAELPGTSISKYIKAEAQMDAETQGAMQVAQAVIQAHGGSGAKVYDQTWMSIRRHGLRYVKDGRSLLEVAKNVMKAKDTAFTKQSNRIFDFMTRRNYEEDEIDVYLASGFLPRIVAASFENYHALLVHARELHMNHPDPWEGGPACTLITYHSDKLLTIRMNAESRRDMILRTYVHLRDSAQKSFYHESITEAIWDQMSTLNEKLASAGPRRGGGGGKTGDGGGKGGEVTKKPTCSHCKSSDLHEAMKVGVGKADCPLADMNGKDARKAAKEIMTEAAATTDADVAVIVAGKLSEA